MIGLIYIMKMVLCSSVLSLYYYIFLRNRNFHGYNRFFIIMIFLLSILLPLFEIPIPEENAIAINLPVFHLIASTNLPEVVLTFKPRQALAIYWTDLAPYMYSVITALLVWRMWRSFSSINKIRKRSAHQRVGDIIVYSTNEPNTPFSFYKWIFWNREVDINSPVGKQMFSHEFIHIREHHTFDLLFVDLCRCIFWFNPIFQLLTKELKTVHEFLADRAAVSAHVKFEYAELLLQHIITNKKYQISHTFFQKQIKRRIAMITTTNKTRFAGIRRLLVLPVLLILAIACSRNSETDLSQIGKSAINNDKKNTLEKATRDTLNVTAAAFVKVIESDTSPSEISMTSGYERIYITYAKGPVYTVLTRDLEEYERATTQRAGGEIIWTKTENPASFPGGTSAWMRYLNKSFRYPEAAIETEVQGTVVSTFVIEKDGRLSDIRATSGPNLLRPEALRVIRESGRWKPATRDGKPVRSMQEFPITFRLEAD